MNEIKIDGRSLSGIFKAYDIRGLSPGEIDVEVAFQVGAALVAFTQARRVVIGRDKRRFSSELADNVARGVRISGADVIDVGLVTTPMFNFAVASDENIDAGIMVTASHNPAEYNGFKLVSRGARPIGINTGMKDIARFVKEGKGSEVATASSRGGQESLSVQEKYLDKIFALAGDLSVSEMSVVFDAGNGMVGVPLADFVRRAGFQAEILYGEVDCTFPNHEANPVKEETLGEIKQAVVAGGAKFGAAFDGDGDRVGFVDDEGERVAGDILAAFLCEDLLTRWPSGALVLGEVSTGRIFQETVELLGGKFELVSVGHANIKEKMRRSGAVFAAENSYHFYYRDFWNLESALLTVLLVAKRLAREPERSFSELLVPFRKYCASGEKNFQVADSSGVIALVRRRFESRARRTLDFDGIRMEFPDKSWFSLRASNTEPLVRLNVEATTREEMEKLRGEVAELLT